MTLPSSHSPSSGTPKPELDLNATLVYQLLKAQHPDLAKLPIQRADEGWDNVMFRVGTDWVVRLPRRKAAAQLIEHEQTWLPVLAKRLPIAVPTPTRIGLPTPDYPWRWSVLPWLMGTAADQQEPYPHQAETFARFLRSLHLPAPENAPHNPYRGVPLAQRADSIESKMQQLQNCTTYITPEIQSIWRAALQAPIDVAPTWIHGDLHPRNILVTNGTITSIIDWGDLTSGDRATDLASIWMLFADSVTHQTALAAYSNLSEATLHRAKGWAIFFGVVLLDTGLIDNPRQAALGARILQRVAQD